MPIIHFSGKFKYQLAYFNNYPKNDARKPDAYDLQSGNKDLKVKYDPELAQKEVHDRLFCDPTKYFEFEFKNVMVTSISYDDDSNIQNEEHVVDPVIGKLVLLKGMLVDLAPHLQRGRLWAGKIRVTDVLIGRIKKATQSSVQRSIRVLGGQQRNKQFHYSAYFEAELYDVYRLEDPYTTKENSKCLRQLNGPNLKIFFTLCRYDINSNEGEVYGYLGESLPSMNSKGLLISNRKLSIVPSIITSEKYKDVINEFNIDPTSNATYPRATFEIQENELQSSLVLRYMEIMPFIDYNNNIPNYRCYLHISSKEQDDDTNEGIVLNCSYEEMEKTGGIRVIRLSDEQRNNIEKLNIAIKIKKSNESIELLNEPTWNIVLDEDECIKMYSNERYRLKGKIFNKAKMYVGDKTLALEAEQNNTDSPLVAWFEKNEVTVTGGKFDVEIVSRNLENSEPIKDPDPVTGELMQGELPWDRYYGNRLFIKLKSESTMLEIMARVIHTFDKAGDPTLEDIKKLFSYYIRYYPWLHVRIDDCYYLQFIDFNDDNLKGNLKNLGKSIKTRLSELQDDDWYKMPRSRDFPKNGEMAIEKFLKSAHVNT